MDGYLSKPIDVDELIATVERFGRKAAPTSAGPNSRPVSEIVVFDERAALAYTGGDRRLLKNVVKLFRSDYPSALRRIDRALRRHDFEALRQAAHGLKGAIATVGGSAGKRLRQSSRLPDRAASRAPSVRARASVTRSAGSKRRLRARI
jgi:hypothetical protein